MTNDTQPEKCSEKIYRGPHANPSMTPCNRPAKEDGKCGLHCASSAARRSAKFEKRLAELQAERERQDITRAIELLKRKGYKVFHPKGERL